VEEILEYVRRTNPDITIERLKIEMSSNDYITSCLFMLAKSIDNSSR